MSLPLFQVDAFTDRPYAGNPAAVCLLDGVREGAWMQQVAREMNLSETAFLTPRADGSFGLRWFTPAKEVDLCGHATLASAHVLWETGALAPDKPAYFHTRSGRLTCARREDWIEMDFPAEPVEACEAPDGLAEALGAAPQFVGRNRMDLFVLLDDADAVRRLAPDMQRLAAIDARGIVATASTDEGAGYDFVSRFFGPRVGVPEDPVTGSAHCGLGPFWTDRLGRDQLVGRQVSTRGGTVRVQTKGDRVVLGGQAVTVLRAELLAA